MALQERSTACHRGWSEFDLVKAFDTVPTEALFTVLKENGLSDAFINVVKKSLCEHVTVLAKRVVYMSRR